MAKYVELMKTSLTGGKPGRYQARKARRALRTDCSSSPIIRASRGMHDPADNSQRLRCAEKSSRSPARASGRGRVLVSKENEYDAVFLSSGSECEPTLACTRAVMLEVCLQIFQSKISLGGRHTSIISGDRLLG